MPSAGSGFNFPRLWKKPNKIWGVWIKSLFLTKPWFPLCGRMNLSALTRGLYTACSRSLLILDTAGEKFDSKDGTLPKFLATIIYYQASIGIATINTSIASSTREPRWSKDKRNSHTCACTPTLQVSYRPVVCQKHLPRINFHTAKWRVQNGGRQL